MEFSWFLDLFDQNEQYRTLSPIVIHNMRLNGIVPQSKTKTKNIFWIVIVYKPSELENLGPVFCPQGPQTAAPHVTLHGGTAILGTTALPFEVPCGVANRGPWGQTSRPLFQCLGVYVLPRPKGTIPHPITIQTNMRFD